MSYQKRLEEMVGKQVAHYQDELSSAKALKGCTTDLPPMPYGYPLSVYRPKHVYQVPQVRQFVAQTGGVLSNGVPKVLRHEFVGGNLLGVYNPRPA